MKNHKKHLVGKSIRGYNITIVNTYDIYWLGRKILVGEANAKYIDKAAGITRVANNEALYNRLLAKFETSVDMSALDESIATTDYVKTGEIVHAAKGVAGNLALAAFFECSEVLMDQLRNGGTPDLEKVEEFKQLYRETVDAINEYLA